MNSLTTKKESRKLKAKMEAASLRHVGYAAKFIHAVCSPLKNMGGKKGSK